MISIGGLCEGLIFQKIFDKRVKGPVDNVAAKNFKATLDLFNGKLLNDMLNDNITKEEYNSYRLFSPSDKEFLKSHDDFQSRYYGDWRSGHINFTLPHRKEELKERIQNFNKFNEDVQNGNENMFYLYTISQFEHTLTKEDFDYTCNNLPKYVIENLIILGADRNPISHTFLDNFRCIIFNFNWSPKNKWNKK